MVNLNLEKLRLPDSVGDLRLRHWTSMDHACVQKAACDPYIPLVTSIPAECDESKAIDWINRQNQKIADGTDLPLCIAVGSTNEAVGMIGVFALNLVAEGSARCGYWISPDRRGKNISGRALAILSSWAFDAFAVQTLELLIESDNIGSIRAAESAGYSVGKTLISHKEIGGTLRDMLIYIRTRNSPGSTDAAK